LGGQLVDVMSDGQTAISGSTGVDKAFGYVVLGDLNLCGGELVVVIRVEIKISDDVAKICQVLLTA